ncbi:hypothetical protein FHR25_002482 [Yokenella regensburgei]|nr:hypothetical protein [Yokenella regensburgei]KAF1368732.1 hypothetical protein FHR25_002482 [Yokenella regensburgei]
MSEKITLSVYRDSPHIWAGGLERKALARWLMARANALLYLDEYQNECGETRETLKSLASASELIRAYTFLGVSRKETDPIHPLSREAMIHDVLHMHLLMTSPRVQDKPVLPVGYSQLPELAEEYAKCQRKKAMLHEQLPDPFAGEGYD